VTPTRKRRLALSLLVLVGIGIAVAFALKAFNENLMFFFSASEVREGKAPATRDFRLGGMVVNGSVHRLADGLTVRFDVTDFAQTVTIQYTGILPDLFREGQGIIAKGRLRDDGIFHAAEVLAKHDEKYMPPEVAKTMKVPGAPEAPK